MKDIGRGRQRRTELIAPYLEGRALQEMHDMVLEGFPRDDQRVRQRIFKTAQHRRIDVAARVFQHVLRLPEHPLEGAVHTGLDREFRDFLDHS